MFTSKKAQYLNKDFDKISPITNIESLYYEQAELIKNGDDPSEYIINRKSVARHMPVKMDLISADIGRGDNISITDLGNYKDAYINTNFTKTIIPNPSNPQDDNKPIFNYEQYQINANKYVNIQKLLQYYTSYQYFSSSIGALNASIDNINSSITNVSNYVVGTSEVADNLINELHNHIEYYDNLTNTLNNGIYNLIYQPSTADSSCIIKVQCISTNTIIKNVISLDRAFNHSNDVSVEQWVFHYDISSNKITYLKDEYGNEGNFDFRIAHIIYNNLTDNSFINNKLYFEPENTNINFIGDGKFEGNEIYNSSNITFTENASNNIVVNCYNVSISGSGNRIYNSANTSTLVIKKSNNTIINCHNSSILVNGNSNYIINSSNLNVSLGNNNIIVDDEIGCFPNTSTLENMKLFFNYSTSTALASDHISSCTFYGGIGNDVSVYVGSLRTTNKY